MSTILRKAIPGDEHAFVAIKDQLPFTMADGTTSTGGFLLGTNAATYREYINSSYCLVAEQHGKPIGFGIIFPDQMLRESDIWQRRNSATWNIDLPIYENKNLCYFEQFAFLTGYKRTAVLLAYNIARWAFGMGHQVMFTTTVNKPIRNLAAIPFINAAEGCHAGNIDETYPLIGHINSDIYMLEARGFYSNAAKHPLYPFVQANIFNY